MARKSHARCRNCGRARHSHARFNLCQRCWALKKPDHKAAWAAMKARRRTRQLAALSPFHPEPQEELAEVLADPVPVAELLPADVAPQEEPDIAPRRHLSDDQELELVEAYTHGNVPAPDLAARFEVPSTYPYKVLDRLGITWRQRDPISFDQWQEAQNPNLAKYDDEANADWRRRASERLSPQIREEVLTHYKDPRISTALISSRYDLNPAVLMEVVRAADVPLRRSDPARFNHDAIRQGHFEANNGTEGSYRFVEDPTPTVLRRERQLPPQIEAMREVTIASAAASEAIPVALSTPVEPLRDLAMEVVSDDNQPVWEVTYTGRMLVKAENIEQAIANARRDGHINTIVGVNLRSRS